MADAPSIKRLSSDKTIEAEIHHLLRTFAPTGHDRHQLEIVVNQGHVFVSGHVKSRPAYTFVEGSLPGIKGVKSLNIDRLYDDETLRIAVGRVLPVGVLVNVEYGAVILDGTLPEETTVEELVKDVALIPGVHRVLTTF